MKHLLLEGAIAAGKSTEILRHLSANLKEAAGYGTVRTFSFGEKGQRIHRGFCHRPADEMVDVDAEYIPDHPGNFIVYEGEGGKVRVDHTVFYRYTFPLLERKGARFILLDEIGGFELLEDAVYDRFLSVFRGDIPCIGVLKSPENMKRTKERLELFAEFDKKYEAFRHALSAIPDLHIFRYERAQREEASALITSWKRSNQIPEVKKVPGGERPLVGERLSTAQRPFVPEEGG